MPVVHHPGVRSVCFNVCYITGQFLLNDIFPQNGAHLSSTAFEVRLGPVWWVWPDQYGCDHFENRKKRAAHHMVTSFWVTIITMFFNWSFSTVSVEFDVAHRTERDPAAFVSIELNAKITWYQGTYQEGVTLLNFQIEMYCADQV
jgi:hypothetical protein